MMAKRGRGGKGSSGMGGASLVAVGLGAIVGYMAAASTVKANFILPPGHKPGMRVPKGGSSCANCKFASIKEDGPHCIEPNFVAWNGGTGRLPVNDASTYCSDWWEPNDAARIQILSESP